MFLATNLICRDEFVLGGNYGKTINHSLTGFGVRLRDSKCRRTAAHSSTYVNSARQRDHQRPNRRLAGKSQVVWACGRNGTFTVATDGGEAWNAHVVAGAEDLEFRDFQGFSASLAYLL